MKICYIERDFSPVNRMMISRANGIIAEYQRDGYRLTLRQLYYQFVSKDLIPNTTQNYKRLGSVVNDARLAGLIDWDAIEDRTRDVHQQAHWESPAEIIRGAADAYAIDKWKGQDARVEIWVEKEALAGVFERIAYEVDVNFFCCRGYTSQSEMHASARRLASMAEREGQRAIILHFGDHDPSGIDMTRDITDRLGLFGADVEIRRVALNMDQVQQYAPPPNPAKITDSRFNGYQQRFGDESWELDALSPKVLAALVRREVDAVRDASLWNARVRAQKQGRELLAKAADQWTDIAASLQQ
jgi:hypothetical protein